MSRKYLFSLIIVTFLASFPSMKSIAEVVVSASLSRQSVSVNQEVRLNIKIDGASGNLQAPKLPSMSGFETFYTGRSSQMSIINGVSSSSVNFSYVLIPKEAGQFSIDPIQVVVGGRNYQTAPITIQVTQGSGASSGSSSYGNQQQVSQTPSRTVQASMPKGADERIFVEAKVDKHVVYQNEQLLLDYLLFTSYDTRYEGFETEPELSGFWIEDFPMDQNVPRETVRVKGRRYIRAEIKKAALFPTAPGDYTIRPGTVKASIRRQERSSSIFDEFFSDSFFSGGGFFSRREDRLLNTEPIQLTVKPLPEQGRPKSFAGSVGQFQMDASIDTQKVKQNDPVTLKVVISGVGNIDRVTRPSVPDLEGFKIYESDTSSEVTRQGGKIGGQKTFEMVFIPRESGNMFIPPLEFSYFDPQIEQYRILRTQNYPIDVEAVEEDIRIPDPIVAQDVFKKDIKVQNRDIRYIVPESDDGKYHEILRKATWGLAGINVLLLLLLIVSFFKKKQDAFAEANSGLVRSRSAKSKAKSQIGRLKKLGRSKKIDDNRKFFEEAERGLTEYLTDKWDFSLHGSTRYELERQLQSHLGEEDELIEEVKGFYELCNESRFAKSEISKSSKDLVIRIFKDTVKKVEKAK